MRVGEHGELRLPADLRRRWGLDAGAELLAEETPTGLLLRRADPALTMVYVEPTSACNLSCRTCVRNSWEEPADAMEMATYRRLIARLQALPSLRKVAFWGFGEPLLHPQIVEMVALASALGARTELVTNGLLLDGATAEGLVAAGLDSLVVSIDGATPETYADARSGADLRQVQENLARLRAARRLWAMRHQSPHPSPEIGIEFVAMRRNVADLPRLPQLAQAMGASLVVVTNVLPYSEALADETLYGLRAGLTLSSPRSKWAPEITLPRMDAWRETGPWLAELLQHTGVPGAAPPVASGADGYCRFVGEGSVAVAWDGGVSPCPALMHSYPCYVMGRRKLIRRWVVGSVGTQALSAIWQSEPFVQFRARVQRFDFAPCSGCGGCPMADTNEEDCYGNPFPVCGDCLWAKGIVQCP